MLTASKKGMLENIGTVETSDSEATDRQSHMFAFSFMVLWLMALLEGPGVAAS